MRGVLRWLRRRSSNPAQRGSAYRSATYVPLRPWQVRQRWFGVTPLGRRGLDPVEVTEFLERVASDLEVLYAELARTHDQNARIKDALRRWQSQQARSREAAGR